MINVNLVTDKFVLPNGLLVVLHREPTASSAFVEVRYHVGSKDDPPGRSGFAHLFEHLMFQGSRHTGDKDHMQWLEDFGGESNAGTNEDHTDYHESVPTSALPLALWLESDRMAYPLDKTDADRFTKEREVVKNEYRQHYDDVAYGHVANIARTAVFGEDHPYARPTIGDPRELDAITLDELRSFARTYYRPNNATLVVCGAFDTAAMKALVTKYFGTIPPGPPPPTRSFRAPALTKDRRIEVQAGVEAPLVTLAWPGPPMHGEGYAELRYGLHFFEGRAHHRLVTEKKIADDVDIDIDTGKLGSLVLATVRLKPKESPSTAISVLEEYLTEASRMGRLYPWDTFRDHRTRAVVSEVTALERLSGRARQILHGIEYHEERETVQLDLKRLLAVRAEDVGAALEGILADRPRVTVVVTPTPGAPRAGRVTR
ncbi:MAG: insulinase family protein [Deltaproteobacteria bacterium]|nr:insulinase family protein [Deltaproteobacteria bacterium]